MDIKSIVADVGLTTSVSLFSVKVILWMFISSLSIAANAVLANKLKKLNTNKYTNNARGIVENITGLLIGSYLMSFLFIVELYIETLTARTMGTGYMSISKYFWIGYGSMLAISLVFFGIILGYADNQIPTLTKEEVRAIDL